MSHSTTRRPTMAPYTLDLSLLDPNREARVVAQVAAEAIINQPSGYDAETVRLVLDQAVALGVPTRYVEMLAEVDQEMAR